MIVGSLVQGKNASKNIINALIRVTDYNKKADTKCDLVVICRGGGSLEDLWSFNEEALASFCQRLQLASYICSWASNGLYNFRLRFGLKGGNTIGCSRNNYSKEL